MCGVSNSHLRVRLPGKDGLEDGPVAVVGVDVHKDNGPGGTLVSEQVYTVHRLQRRLRQAYRAGERWWLGNIITWMKAIFQH